MSCRFDVNSFASRNVTRGPRGHADTRVDFGILAGAGAPVRHFKAGATAIAATDVTLVPVGEKQFLFLVGRTRISRST